MLDVFYRGEEVIVTKLGWCQRGSVDVQYLNFSSANSLIKGHPKSHYNTDYWTDQNLPRRRASISDPKPFPAFLYAPIVLHSGPTQDTTGGEQMTKLRLMSTGARIGPS